MVRTRPTELLWRDGEALLVLVLAVLVGRDGEVVVLVVLAGRDGEAVVVAVVVVGVVAQALHVEVRKPMHGLRALLQAGELPVHGVEELRLHGAVVRADRLMAGIHKSRLYQ